MDWLLALITLTAMEIVLGIDNIVFIAILSGRLPVTQRALARSLGLGAALVTRLLLLLSLNWLLGLTEPVFRWTDVGVPAGWVVRGPTQGVPPHPGAGASGAGREAVEAAFHDMNGVSWRDLFLVAGGLFLIGKSVTEIHVRIGGGGAGGHTDGPATLPGVLFQIAVLDVIFSLDSVITAVGMAQDLWVMVTAVVLSVIVMLWSAGPISRFVEANPTLKILALSFLILIGVVLVSEGVGTPVNKGYIYFAMAFAVVVEMINLRVRGEQSTEAAH